MLYWAEQITYRFEEVTKADRSAIVKYIKIVPVNKFLVDGYVLLEFEGI